MNRYAAKTEVSTDTSRTEIERTLRRYNATSFAYAWEGNQAMIAFEAYSRRIKFVLPLPPKEDFERTPSRRSLRSPAEIDKAWEQGCRQCWRALVLVIKAKLEAVEAGITTFESEFLAHIVLPDGSTVGQWAEPQIERAYVSGQMPKMLPSLSGEVTR